jgi:hypothetical protein
VIRCLQRVDGDLHPVPDERHPEAAGPLTLEMIEVDEAEELSHVVW